LLALCALLAAAHALRAQELEISVSPTPVGSGARAAGMADAFVAVADDATAASWNPAGLVQLERPEFSVVGAYNGVAEALRANHHDEFESHPYTDNLDLNYLSVAYPLPVLVLGRNVCVSLNYQNKYDFTRRFSFKLNRSAVVGSGTVLNQFQKYRFEQEGGLSAISPAVAFEITHRISVGAAFNFWEPTFLCPNGWEQVMKTETTGFLGPLTTLTYYHGKENYRNFSGRNVTLGILWSPTDRLSFGMRYDSAFTGDADYRRELSNTQLILPSSWGGGQLDAASGRRNEERHVRFPDSLALGTAYRFSDRFMMSLDITRTDWNDFYVVTGEGQHRSLVDFSNLDNPWTRTHFKATNTVRLGSEYVFLPKEPEEQLARLWSVRGGIFFDQEPATGKSAGFRWPGDNGSGKPDNFYGFAAGVGLLLNQRINIDAAYQLRAGFGVNRDFIRGLSGFEENVVQHRILLSTVIYL